VDKPTTPVAESAATPPDVPAWLDLRSPLSAGRLVEIVQTVLTGLLLAFIFRAFLVEPFIIPTGSMADALLGRHATQTCPFCGWEYKYAPLRSATPYGGEFVCPPDTICPNCQSHIETLPEQVFPQAGDRILVHKWPTALGGPFAPARWDVIVFRDPGSPLQHYIKRLVGLPGESVEILDGDVFIDGRIARKPDDVQEALWMIVYDQAHAPVLASPTGHRPRWVSTDFSDDHVPGWTGLQTRVIRYDGLDATRRKLRFNYDAAPEYLLDFYAYNRRSSGTFVGDVRVVSDFALTDGAGVCRIELVRPPYSFAVELHRAGQLQFLVQNTDSDEPPRTLRSLSGPEFGGGTVHTIEFGHVDYRVYLKLDGRELFRTTDAEYTPAVERLRNAPGARPIELYFSAENLRLELRGLRIDRDVHYTSRADRILRGGPGNPFTLKPGEYFVLGDNSPDSHDSREWTETGPHLPPDYRPGTVRADQIVGQAAFVYLPGLLPLGTSGRWSVPDLGRVRFVR
jgi:signal peptidase I